MWDKKTYQKEYYIKNREQLLKLAKELYYRKLKREKSEDWNKGSNNPAWRGGIHKAGGYIFIWIPHHPNSDKHGYYPEHRLVMEKHIGRFLKKEERVHHINGQKNDNRIENLMLLNNVSEHCRIHNDGRFRGVMNRTCICKICGKSFSSVQALGGHVRHLESYKRKESKN